MAALPWMPLYVADYLADTMHLSAQESGAYLFLIFHYWQHGGLPQSDGELARIARLTARQWLGSKPVLSALFLDNWRHKRIDQEIGFASANLTKKTAAGKAGAAARYGKRNAVAMRSHNQSDAPSPSPSPKQEESKKEEIQVVLRSPSSRPPKRAKSELPENFPSQEALEAACEHWLSKGRSDLAQHACDEAAQFRDHHTKNATRFADWDAAWRTWARNSVNFNKAKGRSNGHSQESLAEGAAELIGDLRSGKYVPGQRV